MKKNIVSREMAKKGYAYQLVTLENTVEDRCLYAKTIKDVLDLLQDKDFSATKFQITKIEKGGKTL